MKKRKIKASLLELVTRQEFLLSLLVFNTAIKVLAKAIREIRDKELHAGKEKGQGILICRWHVSIH